MSFEMAYEVFIDEHTRSRSGEGLRRFKEGHQHAEKLFMEQIWWPSFGNFHYLHPEYKVRDFKDGTRFLDFAYIRHPLMICIEIDGYGSHCQQINRWQFADNLIRQNHLVIDGWMVIRFSYDDIVDKPRRCQQIIQQLIGRWLGKHERSITVSAVEKETLRLIARKDHSITPFELCEHLGIKSKYARRLLHDLTAKGLLSAASGGKSRIRSYRLQLDDHSLLF